MKQGLMPDVQFHSKGKEIDSFVGFNGVRCGMINFLLYKDHQAVMWKLGKMGGDSWVREAGVEIDRYCSHCSKRFKYPEQRKLLPRTSLGGNIREGKVAGVSYSCVFGAEEKETSPAFRIKQLRGSLVRRTHGKRSRFLSETLSPILDVLRVKC